MTHKTAKLSWSRFISRTSQVNYFALQALAITLESVADLRQHVNDGQVFERGNRWVTLYFV
jgi:hypothetical protein